jgi:hypothetical protein
MPATMLRPVETMSVLALFLNGDVIKRTAQALLISLVTVFSLAVWGAPAELDGVNVRRYALPQRGYVELKVPTIWRAKVSQTTKTVPPVIEFAARNGQPFIFTLTPLGTAGADGLPANTEELRKRVEYAASGIQPFALETKLNLLELKGTAGAGFYFVATDQAPMPGGYKFLARGAILIGDLTLMFTLLTNEGQEDIVRQALAMLESARYAGTARLPRNQGAATR